MVCNSCLLPAEHKAAASILRTLTREEQGIRVDLEELLKPPSVSLLQRHQIIGVLALILRYYKPCLFTRWRLRFEFVVWIQDTLDSNLKIDNFLQNTWLRVVGSVLTLTMLRLLFPKYKDTKIFEKHCKILDWELLVVF